MTLLAATIQKADTEFASAGISGLGKVAFREENQNSGVLVQLISQRQSEQKPSQFLELASCASYFGIQPEKALPWCQRKGANGRLSFHVIRQEQLHVGCAWGISSL